jgi:hypothetical protein
MRSPGLRHRDRYAVRRRQLEGEDAAGPHGVGLGGPGSRVEPGVAPGRWGEASLGPLGFVVYTSGDLQETRLAQRPALEGAVPGDPLEPSQLSAGTGSRGSKRSSGITQASDRRIC